MQPLHYLTTTGGMIWTAVCVLFGVLFTWLSYQLINRIPAAWLCDYNETPTAELLSGKRVNYTRSGIIVSIVTAACFVLCRLQFNKGYDIYFIVFALMIVISLMIAICDIKYTIIPDQFTIALAVLGLLISVYDIVRGFGILHTSWWSPLAGAAIGAGTMIIIDLIGMIIYKRTGMGFGDVKLFAAIGLCTGFSGTIIAFIISMITAMVCFCVILLVVRIISRKSSEKETPDEVRAVSADSTAEKSDLPETDVSSENNDDKAEEQSAENADEKAQDENRGGSYLAFGPYIALSLICYLCFYDFIYQMVESYLKLF